MKKLTIKFQSLILMMAVSVIFTSCGGGKKIQNVNKSQKIIEPFDGKNYATDKNTYRAVASSNSPDIQDAKNLATQKARDEIGAQIKVQLQKVADNYTNKRSENAGGEESKEFKEKYETFSRNIINESISGSYVKDHEVFQEQDRSYTSYVVVELNVSDVLNAASSRLSKDQKLLLDYDQQKFKEEFEKALRDLENKN